MINAWKHQISLAPFVRYCVPNMELVCFHPNMDPKSTMLDAWTNKQTSNDNSEYLQLHLNLFRAESKSVNVFIRLGKHSVVAVFLTSRREMHLPPLHTNEQEAKQTRICKRQQKNWPWRWSALSGWDTNAGNAEGLHVVCSVFSLITTEGKNASFQSTYSLPFTCRVDHVQEFQTQQLVAEGIKYKYK